MATVLVTGADRGIGAALVRAYHARGDHAIACCLGEGVDLLAAGLQVEPHIDVTSLGSLKGLHRRLAHTRIDILINNAGAYIADGDQEFNYQAMLELYNVNALGPLRVVQTLSPCMDSGGKIGIITSRVGSLADNRSGGMYGYRASKAAANMMGLNLYHDLRPRGIAVMLLHPGQVATAMTRKLGGLTGFITPEESAAGLLARIDELGPDTPPEFRHMDGTRLPW